MRRFGFQSWDDGDAPLSSEGPGHPQPPLSFLHPYVLLAFRSHVCVPVQIDPTQRESQRLSCLSFPPPTLPGFVYILRHPPDHPASSHFARFSFPPLYMRTSQPLARRHPSARTHHPLRQPTSLTQTHNTLPSTALPIRNNVSCL